MAYNYKPIKEAITVAFHQPEVKTPYGRPVVSHMRTDIGGLYLPWYPDDSKEIILHTLQDPNYFKSPIHKRYEAIDKGEPVL